NGIMPILQPWLHHGALRTLLMMNVVLVPGTLLVALWLVCKVIQDAGVSNLQNTLPVFQAKMRLVALRDKRLDLLLDAYSKLLASSLIEHNNIAWHKSARTAEWREEF